MAATMSHVFECENELNDNLYNLKLSNKKRTSSQRVKKILKPLLRFLKKSSSNGAKKMSKSIEGQRAEPQVEIFTEEVDNQNNANEALEQRLIADLQDAEEGAAITVCLDGQMTVVPVVPGQCYVPVHFAHTHAGDFYWTTMSLADSDLCYKERAFSQNQLPEMQVA
ncbi:enhancer of split malpha protein-like [Athalia rosae]|uniref:enhancer of split malpha protein-like n=1 Tax=Athalia rosae TaxID=37344 RepID=UPI0020349526|nr:enhancer of split malpha protein-like [Athalia rosae]